MARCPARSPLFQAAAEACVLARISASIALQDAGVPALDVAVDAQLDSSISPTRPAIIGTEDRRFMVAAPRNSWALLREIQPIVQQAHRQPRFAPLRRARTA